MHSDLDESFNRQRRASFLNGTCRLFSVAFSSSTSFSTLSLSLSFLFLCVILLYVSIPPPSSRSSRFPCSFMSFDLLSTMAIELPTPNGVGGNPGIAFYPTLVSPRAQCQSQSGISLSGPDQGTTYSQVSPPMNSLSSAMVLFGNQQHQQQALGVPALASEAPGGYWGFQYPSALFPWPEPSSVSDLPAPGGDPFTTLERQQLFEPQPLWTPTNLQGQPEDDADEPVSGRVWLPCTRDWANDRYRSLWDRLPCGACLPTRSCSPLGFWGSWRI